MTALIHPLFRPQKQRHQHECLLAAFASYAGVDLEQLAQAVGHRGQLPLFADDHSGSGYQPGEIINALYRANLIPHRADEVWLFVTPEARLFYRWGPDATTETIVEYAGDTLDLRRVYASVSQQRILGHYMQESGVVAYETGSGYYHAMLWDASRKQYWDVKSGEWLFQADRPWVRPCFFFQRCIGSAE